MTIHTAVECDACGEREKPPQNQGFLVLLVTGPDGVNPEGCDGHLCRACRLELHRWVKARREQIERAKAARTAKPS